MPGLLDDVAATGATVVCDALDPVSDLVRVQRLAVALAEAAGLDPDRPRNLSRSVVLGAPMILCVAPSPAWDVTYGVDRFREHATNRAHSVSASRRRQGGQRGPGAARAG